MKKQLTIAMALSLLLSATPAVLAAPQSNDLSSPIDIPGTTKDPLVQEKPSAASADTSTPPATPPANSANSGTSTPAVSSPDGSMPAPSTPAASTSPEKKPESGENWSWMQEKGKADSTVPLKNESPEVAKPDPALKTETPHESKPAQTAHATPLMSAPQAVPGQKKTPMRLFGRIEEITGNGAAKFPELKAMTAKMDTRGTGPEVSGIGTTFYSGKVIKSFPPDLKGTWGGTLRVMQFQEDPSYYALDPDEYIHEKQVMKVGMDGSANFVFKNLGTAKVSLEPTQVMFMVPAGETLSGQAATEQAAKMMGGPGAGAMGQVMAQVMAGMPVPILLNFGEIDTAADPMLRGVSGNAMKATVLKNDIRQLAEGVMEQQIVTQESSYNKRTGRARTGYGESVIRFTAHGPNQMFVQAASVSYGPNRKFLYKVLLEGYVGKGNVMQTDPYQASMGGMQSMLGVPGMQMKPGQMPQMPNIPGMNQIPGLQDMMKQMLGQ